MKKEDLCMLLMVVALVLIISRNTSIFEGYGNSEEEEESILDIFGGSPTPSEPEGPAPVPPSPAPRPAAPQAPRPAAPPAPKPAAPPAPRPVAPPAPRPAAPPAPRPAAPPAPRPAAPPAPRPAAPPAPRPAAPPAPSVLAPSEPVQRLPPTQPVQRLPPTPPVQRLPPTPPVQRLPTPPTQPAPPTPVKQVQKKPMVQPEQKPSPFGTPLMGGDNGAFGQGWITAFDTDTDMFASASGEDQYGEKIPVSMQQEYLTMKSLGTLTPQIMLNMGEQRSQGTVMGSEFKPWDPSSTSGALLDTQFGGVPSGPTPPQLPPSGPAPPPSRPVTPPTPPTPQVTGGGGAVEVHMVYGEWCGHSKKAKPAFQELVSNTSITTGSGSPVKFVMTTDDSPEMAQFKEKVRGFPTYMVVKPDGSMEELNGHDRSKEAIINAVKSL
jgi:thiol-disulfide isomerase/thioredoxin